ncbi:hypothetical protein [Filobacillus milosensis]|uniref:hypothetical protein n=1 Tax=Filobacillus milosensis TaxID=94137 RepID=UPI00129B5A06|nr:hypothetical protein [Filobacillus milosensis]
MGIVGLVLMIVILIYVVRINSKMDRIMKKMKISEFEGDTEREVNKKMKYVKQETSRG